MLTRYTASYLSERGSIISYVLCDNIENALVNFLDRVKHRHPDYSIKAIKVCTDDGGRIAYAYGETWSLHVINTEWQAERLALRRELTLGTGKSRMPE